MRNYNDKITAEELINEIKNECLHNIEILEQRRMRARFHCLPPDRVPTDYERGYADGQLRWDMDMLEKIEQWERTK